MKVIKLGYHPQYPRQFVPKPLRFWERDLLRKVCVHQPLCMPPGSID